MSSLDQIVNIAISQQTQAVPQASFSIPAIFGPSSRFAGKTTTANTASGSNRISNIASMTGVVPGASITGSGIPAGTYIQSVASGIAFLSNNATATATGVSVTVTDAIRAYTDTAGMLADGFQISDPEYIRASEELEQSVVPALFYVGKYSASVAQVDTLQVGTLDTSHLYTFKINGVLVSYQATGGDTQQSILTALLADIATVFPSGAPVTGAVTSTGPSATLTLTSVQTGVPVAYSSIDTDLTHLNTVANHTIVTDIQQAQVQNDSWYGLAISSNLDADILQVAAYIETLKKIFLGVSSDSDIPTSSTSDLGSTLKALGYKRTALIFTLVSQALGVEAAWMGGQLPATPGSNNWAFKTLVGIPPDTLSANQQANLIGVPEAQVPGKNVNIYQTVGGVNITEMGTMAGGQYIDITIGIDWLQSTVQTNLFAALVEAAKIPYTDVGVTILLAAVKSAIDQGVVNGLIDGNSPITVTAPSVLSVPASQRANRVAPTISFSCRLQGAVNAVVVKGTVTV